MPGYRDLFDASITDPAGFWADAATAVTWTREPQRILDDSNPPFYRWFPDAELNTCANALDRHVYGGQERSDSGISYGGRAEQPALIYDSAVTDTKRVYTYAELLDETARFAGALRGLGVGKGDRVVIYMPMIPEAVIAMLACARLGAVHSVVFGGFAPHELAVRIDDVRPTVIVSASCGIEPTRVVEYKPMLDAAIAAVEHPPTHCVVVQRDRHRCDLIEGRDVEWADVMASAQPVDPVPVAATDPLYVLYTSGTTGKPKGIVRDNGGHAVALLWSMRHIYDIAPGDVFWAASDVGWVVGHSYIVYAPLLLGATTVLYEGKPVGTPDPGAFWRVASEHGVKALFTAPTAIRAIRKEDPEAKYLADYDLSGMKYLFLAGERLDPDTYHWATDNLGVPVIDHWWQTETGWAIAANPMGAEALPVKAGSPTVPMPGYDIHVLHDDGNRCEAGEEGAICIRLPLPPGTLPTLWNAEARYEASYLSEHPGYYLTGDGGRYDEDGYLFVMGRIDDVINVAGHRMSTGAIEEVLATHPAVAECAVIGVPDEIKGQAPRGLVVVKSGASTDGLAEELVRLVRDEIGAVAAFRLVDVVPALPKTRSGKILRKTLRGIAAGRDEPVPSTIEDPGVLDTLAPILRS
ncbi:propionyl-CoA synthetase [Mycolicibacterium poriferae]|uniref:Propionyl-CoA synthetase n=1 Tax=Mycolicibacterium poriferae TaxID=39694 RepID=A0A6N4VDL9_9MYCO|nr:propionyl-CoA synthetase [Mycolicibacterium poriferae]MCV7265920.1 propionyl-CoA synthetase [Mycolicibacterium poriferae]BBX53882.1 propionyl-CoA synthetase [Mycolicibacterium poriferae]